MKNFFVAIALLTALHVGASNSHGAIIQLNFEGLKNLESINGFYDGGTGSLGSTGTNYGVQFSTNALAIIDSDAGGSGNFGGEPSPSTVMFFLSGTPYMNVSAGFTTGFSVFYSAINQPGQIDIWDGLNGTGTLLATLSLPLTPFNGAPDPTGAFSPFVAAGVLFNGTAKSVTFGGVQNQIGFDNVTFGSDNPNNSNPVPEPASILLLSFGGIGLAAGEYRRRNAVNS